MYEKLGNFIHGEWRTSNEIGQDVLNPANESVLAFLPHATEKDLEDAKKFKERNEFIEYKFLLYSIKENDMNYI